MGRKNKESTPDREGVIAVHLELDRALSEALEILRARRGKQSRASYVRMLLIDAAQAAGLLREPSLEQEGQMPGTREQTVAARQNTNHQASR